MIKVEDLPEPEFISGPAQFALWAVGQLELAEAHEDKIRKLEAHKNHPLSDERLGRLQAEVSRYLQHAHAAILFAAMEVEAAFNFHGVVMLGNDYFDRNLERLRPEEKLSNLVAIAHQQLIEKADPIFVATKRLFGARNKLAHPKTKAFLSWEKVKDEDDEWLVVARQAVADMKAIQCFVKELLPNSLHDD